MPSRRCILTTGTCAIEHLEARIAPAVFTVTTVDDSGPGSFRQALLDANATGGQDAVVFDIPGSGLQVIASGGVSSIQDIAALHESGLVAGAILGTALYESKIDLAEAIRLARKN